MVQIVIKLYYIMVSLCRIGYPIFTLGIGCKSYVQYRFRLHKKRSVAKENQFYYTLLQKSLVPELTDQNDSGAMSLEFANNMPTSAGLSNSGKLLTNSTNMSNQLSLTNPIANNNYHNNSNNNSAGLENLHGWKNQSISVHSNGTNTAMSRASSSHYTNNSSSTIKNKHGDYMGNVFRPNLSFRTQTLARSLIVSLCSVFMIELKLKSRLLTCAVSLRNSIHNLTSKVLFLFANVNEPSTTNTNLNNASNSQTTGMISTVEAISANGTDVPKYRRGSIANDIFNNQHSSEYLTGDKTNECKLNSSGEFSHLNTNGQLVTLQSKTRNQHTPNGSINRGKSLDSNDPLKKSNFSRT